jgi:ubiquinone/menaquinone biosynthesis C-methylase UbiE
LRTETRVLRIPAFPVPPRSDALEHLDTPADHTAELRANLRDIRRLNAWFGGTRLAVNLVEQSLEGRRGARVLDVATGSADIPLALSRWGASHGINLDIVGADISPEVISEARRCLVGSDIRLARADARSLPWSDESFDIVCCCLALHHFSPLEAVQVLREMWRVTSGVIAVTDLTRSYPAYIATWLATHTVAPNALTRHDGPLSVLRAYTPEEMRDLASAAGIAHASVRLHPLFRQALVGSKDDSSGHE